MPNGGTKEQPRRAFQHIGVRIGMCMDCGGTFLPSKTILVRPLAFGPYVELCERCFDDWRAEGEPKHVPDRS